MILYQPLQPMSPMASRRTIDGYMIVEVGRGSRSSGLPGKTQRTYNWLQICTLYRRRGSIDEPQRIGSAAPGLVVSSSIMYEYFNSASA